jgi:pterin-4a-carbinolamine dehydratase
MSQLKMLKSLLTEQLKGERVQEALERLPGWRLVEEVPALERVVQFEEPAGARRFVDFVCRVASLRKQPVTIGLAGEQVVVTLQGHPVRGCTGGLTNTTFDLAGIIG